MFTFSRFITYAAVAAVLTLVGETAAHAVNVEGQLDPHFGNSGKVFHVFIDHSGTTPSVLSSVARAVAVQSDGKIVVAGDVNLGDGGIALARFNPDGSLDTSFGTQGERLLDFPNVTMHVRAMVIQPDDKIVLAGAYQHTGNDQDFLAIRFNADGVNADTSFGLFGLSITDFAGDDDLATSLAIAGNGSLYLAGYESSTFGDKDFGVLKLKPNGIADTNFGNQGKVGIFFDQGGSTANNDDTAYQVAVQSDGNVLASGYVTLSNTESAFGLMRVSGNSGALDQAFGNLPARPGRSVAQYGASCRDYAAALKLDESLNHRRIYAAGTTCLSQTYSAGVLAAFDDDGTLDTDFGSTGNGWYYQKINLDLNYASRRFTTMVLQASKKTPFSAAFGPSYTPIAIGFGRSNQYNQNADMLIDRVNYDGTPDPTFGASHGRQAVFFNYAGGQGDDFAYASTMVGNGYLVVVGSRQRNGSGATDFAIARLLVGDGIFESGFEFPLTLP